MQNSTEEEVVLNNYGLVKNIALKYKINSGAFSLEDLIQIGLMSLVKAHRRYDKERAPHFSTFATICVRNDISKFMKSNRNTIQYEEIKDSGVYYENFMDIMPDLTEEEKSIIEYRLANNSVAESAEMLNIPKAHLKHKKNQLFKKIKKANE